MKKFFIGVITALILFSAQASLLASQDLSNSITSLSHLDVVNDGDDDDGGFSQACPSGMDHDDDDGDGDGGWDDDDDGYGDDDDGDGAMDCIPKECPAGTVRDDNGDGYADDDDNDGYGDDDDDDGYGDDRGYRCVPACDLTAAVSVSPPSREAVEGNLATFTIALDVLSIPAACNASIQIETMDSARNGNRSATANEDYTPRSSLFEFTGTNVSTAVSIDTLVNLGLELDETFVLKASPVPNSVITNSDEGVVTIIKQSITP